MSGMRKSACCRYQLGRTSKGIKLLLEGGNDLGMAGTDARDSCATDPIDYTMTIFKVDIDTLTTDGDRWCPRRPV